MYELLVIECRNEIDRVLIVKSPNRDDLEYIGEAINFADWDIGGAEIVERIPLTESQANALDTMRPYMG